MRLLFFGINVLCFCAANFAFAEPLLSADDGKTIPINGTACERFNASEAKSTVRVRVTDKASFLAVSAVDEVSSFREDMNEHDYNVLVYGLVDNAIEDMIVKTTKQNDEELCVMVSGYISLDNILKAVADFPQNSPQQTQQQETMTDIVKEVNTSYSELPDQPSSVIPPSDEDVIEKHKAPVTDAQETLSTGTVEKTTSEDKLAITDDKRGLVYIAPAEFFDKTTSDVHAKTLKDMFENDDGYFVTDKKDLADYIIKAKVLRAKVDAINSSTKRLQMVISVEVEFPDEKASAVEHQNRFVLFNSSENEQEVAFKLLKKLLSSAGEKIKEKVDQAERRRRPDKAFPDIITPAASK